MNKDAQRMGAWQTHCTSLQGP